MTKVIKKGTKVILHGDINRAGCATREEYVLENDMTEDDLNEFAYEQAMEEYQVEGYFTLAGDDDDEG